MPAPPPCRHNAMPVGTLSVAAEVAPFALRPSRANVVSYVATLPSASTMRPVATCPLRVRLTVSVQMSQGDVDAPIARAVALAKVHRGPLLRFGAVKGYVDQGFTALKFGWGVFGADPWLDVQLVEAAREELGPRKDLLVDTGWFVDRTPKEAIQVVRSIEPFAPYLVEELLHPEDYDGYRQVSEAVETRIACGEQEATEWGFQTLIERGRVDVLQPDLTRCGGFTTARKIVHMADRANRLVIPHSWSSDLLTAASLHLVAFQRRAAFVEFSTSQGPLSRMLVKQPLRLEDGYVRIPEGPGLGVEVNDAVIDEYRVA